MPDASGNPTIQEQKDAINAKEFITVDEAVILIDGVRSDLGIKNWIKTGHVPASIVRRPGGRNSPFVLKRQEFMEWFRNGGANSPSGEIENTPKAS